MAKSKLVKANEKIADKVVNTYKKIENTVTGTYTKIEDKFIDQYLTKDGETIEDAKKRLKGGKNEKRNVIRNNIRYYWWINFFNRNVHGINF